MEQNNIKWTIPYVDQPIAFWQKIVDEFAPQVQSVYLPLPDCTCGSGRPTQPRKHQEDFLRSKILPVSLLVNPIILHEPVEKIGTSVLQAVRKALQKWQVVEMTITNIDIARMIKTEYPEMPLVASTLLDVFNVQQLLYLNDFDVLVPSTRISRDLNALRELKKNYSGKIRMMVNEGCLPHCPQRTQHFFEMSCPEILYPKSLCEHMLQEIEWMPLTGSWILPQHLYLFEGVFDELKLAGRVALSHPEKYKRVLSQYVRREPLGPHEIGAGPAGLHRDIFVSDDFYKYTLTCGKNCLSCQHCSQYWEQAAYA